MNKMNNKILQKGGTLSTGEKIAIVFFVILLIFGLIIGIF